MGRSVKLNKEIRIRQTEMLVHEQHTQMRHSLLADVKWQAVYWGTRGQRESNEEHFGLPSGWPLELLRAWMRGGVTSLVSPGSSESRWGALRDSREEGRSHLQPNKQLDTQSLGHLPRPWRIKGGRRLPCNYDGYLSHLSRCVWCVIHVCFSWLLVCVGVCLGGILIFPCVC